MKFDTSRLVYRKDLSDENFFYIEVLPPTDKESYMNNLFLTGKQCFIFEKNSDFYFVSNLENPSIDSRNVTDLGLISTPLQNIISFLFAVTLGYTNNKKLHYEAVEIDSVGYVLSYFYRYRKDLCVKICDFLGIEVKRNLGVVSYKLKSLGQKTIDNV